MKKIIFFCLMAVFLSSALVFASDDCSYCVKLEKLKKEFSKVKPEPLNEKTIDKQNELLDRTETLVEEIAKSGISDLDLARIVGLLAIAAPYDSANLLGEDLHSVLKPIQKRFDAEIKRQVKEKIITKEQAEELILTIAIGEGVLEHGSDSQD